MSVDIHKWMGSDPSKLKKQQGVRLRNFGHQQLSQNSAILSLKQPNDDHADAPTADYLAIIIASVMSLWRNSETQAPCTNQNSASLAIRNFVGGDNWRMKIASLITTGTTQPNIRMRQGTRSEVQVLCSPPPRPTSNFHTTANLPSTSEGSLHGLENFGFGNILSINKDANYIKASDFVGQLRQNCRNHLGRGECNTVVTSLNRMRNDTNSLSVRVTTSQGEVCYQNLQRDIFPVLFLVNQLQATSELYRQIQVFTNFISCLVTVRQILLGRALVEFVNLCKNEQVKNDCQTSFNSEKTYNKLNCEKLSTLSNSLSFESGNMAFRGNEFEGGDEMQEGNMGGDGGVDLPHVVPDYGNFVDRDDDEQDDDFDEELEDGRGANGGAALRGRFAEIDDHRVPQNGHGAGRHDGEGLAQILDEFANGTICNFDEIPFYERQINEPQLPPPDEQDFLMEVDVQEWADLELLALPEDFDAANAA